LVHGIQRSDKTRYLVGESLIVVIGIDRIRDIFGKRGTRTLGPRQDWNTTVLKQNAMKGKRKGQAGYSKQYMCLLTEYIYFRIKSA